MCFLNSFPALFPSLVGENPHNCSFSHCTPVPTPSLPLHTCVHLYTLFTKPYTTHSTPFYTCSCTSTCLHTSPLSPHYTCFHYHSIPLPSLSPTPSHSTPLHATHHPSPHLITRCVISFSHLTHPSSSFPTFFLPSFFPS